MSTDSLETQAFIAAEPATIRDAWLDGDRHAAMIGAGATVADDGSFTAWNGYISGRTLEVSERRIVQAWRTTQFPDDAPDSRLVIELEPVEGGTNVRLVHTEIPAGQGPGYDGGWVDHYFEPMKKYFSG